MGEVYRADDLKLGQPVALKFLPPKLSDDPVRRERFFAEVRITRQLSHPNICRVYDIGEVDDKHFLSMEYIDGEDLASLMKRIGSLTNEKALDIARQLVAGLTVAHERGMLHRDLKPANIMLDGHGRVRITDFGLAIAAEDESQAEEIAGTPAYMAPEQLAGKGATVRSDIYSLGLILYEIYTGKKAFTAKTLAELREQKETQTPRAPSEIRGGIDPVVERVIQRCMEKDPNARPASVAQLAQALPGGDPLAAAIAAGETPSPEMVAASGGREGFRPGLALLLLAIIVGGILVAMLPASKRLLSQAIPFEKSPDALVERCRLFLEKAELSGQFEDSAHGFIHIQNSDTKAERWKKPDAREYLFWYRQSPEDLGIGSSSPDNPPMRHPDEVLVMYDSEMRLVSFRRMPGQSQSVETPAQTIDWTIFFNEAGLDLNQWEASEDHPWNPTFYADKLEAWPVRIPSRPGTDVWIEAASFQGKPVSFEIIDPWAKDARQASLFEQIAGTMWVIIIGTANVCGIFFARRNLRLGRGDRRNATRLALFTSGAVALFWFLRLPKVPLEYLLISIVYVPILFWFFYVAFEPYVRRKWPQVLVSWTRLLSGEWRDPLVSSETLVGIAFGVVLVGIGYGMTFLPSIHFGGIDLFVVIPSLELTSLLGTRYVISEIIVGLLVQLYWCMMTLCSLAVLSVLLKSKKAAIGFMFLVATVGLALSTGGFALALVGSAVWFFALIRFGLIAMFFTAFAFTALRSFPIILSKTWCAHFSYFILVLFAAIVLYAFRYSLGGRPLLAPSRLDD
jgi:serine/threonine-protein kinase